MCWEEGAINQHTRDKQRFITDENESETSISDDSICAGKA
jgi:hypothetical protein